MKPKNMPTKSIKAHRLKTMSMLSHCDSIPIDDQKLTGEEGGGLGGGVTVGVLDMEEDGIVDASDADGDFEGERTGGGTDATEVADGEGEGTGCDARETNDEVDLGWST